MGKAKHLLLMFCAIGILFLLIIGLFSFGWFVNNKTVEGFFSTLTAADLDFELGAVGVNGAFDEYLAAENGTLLTDINTDNPPETISPVVTGNGKNEIKWLMNSGSNFNNYPGENAKLGIQPGSSGKLTFYVIAKRDTSLDITFSLDTVLYTSEAKIIDGNNADNSAYIIANTQQESALANGHILFFENCVDGVYSNRISDGRFNFSKPDAKAGTAYRVDIFWIWPEVVDQIIMPENDRCFESKEYKKIISDTDTAAFKAELISNPEKYFSATDFGVSEIIENVSEGTGSAGFNSEYYGLLNEKWNSADQIIGKKVGFIELQISNVDT